MTLLNLNINVVNIRSNFAYDGFYLMNCNSYKLLCTL